MILKPFTLIILLFTLSATFGQQPGDLDMSFANNGIKLFNSANDIDDLAYTVGLQSSGKIVVAGISGSDMSIIRYNINGALDTTFGIDGQTLIPIGNTVKDLIILPNGKILLTGSTSLDKFVLIRLEVDGLLDSSFGEGGILTTSISNTNTDQSNAMVTQADGKILLAGNSIGNITTVRYNIDGTLDNTFGNEGIVITSNNTEYEHATSIALQEDGRYFVSGGFSTDDGWDALLIKYNSDGSIDNSFGTMGSIIISDIIPGNDNNFVSEIAIQSNGKVLVTGRSSDGFNSEMFLLRYNADGTLDASFDNDGVLLFDLGEEYDSGNTVIVQPDEKILVAGKSDSNIIILRINLDGTLDSAFGDNGIVISTVSSSTASANDMILDTDGNIVLVGHASTPVSYSFVTARYFSGLLNNIDFTLDNSILIYPNPVQDEVILEYTLENNENISVGLYDVSGKLIKSIYSNKNRTKGNHKETINLNNIVSGSYILKLNNNNNNSQGIKLVKL